MKQEVSQSWLEARHVIDDLPDLEKSTQMFGQLAAPTGANNALAQVLYGLALRSDSSFEQVWGE